MARAISWGNYEASADGGFEQIPAGGYVAKIVDMVDTPQKEYVELIFDIAEGDKAGYYSDDFGKKHPYTHRIFLSYKETAIPMLKGRMEAIQASNSGFDPFAAWDAGRFDMFTNRLLGINLQEEEYKNKYGEVNTRMTVCQVIPAQDVRDGKVKARALKKLDKGGAQAATTPTMAPGSMAAQAAAIEVPFD